MIYKQITTLNSVSIIIIISIILLTQTVNSTLSENYLPNISQSTFADQSTIERFVIIAHDSFYSYQGEWNLQRLADWHNQNDSLTTYIINSADIFSNTSFYVTGYWGDANPNNPYKRADEDPITNLPMFNDSAAKIRNYLRYAHHELNVRYALLVGDTNSEGQGYIPVRRIYARGSGAPAKQYVYHEIIPTDNYYACLDGTFNADEDTNSANPPYSGWGENATESADAIDECDWGYEIAVGRFSVDNTIQLSNAIRKTIAYMNQDISEPYLKNVTLAGHYGGWGGQAEWCASYSKTLNNTIYDSWWYNAITYGFDSEEFMITIVDENPNREEGIAYTDANTRALFNQGCHVWYQSGHGSTNGWAGGHGGDSFTITDINALSNTKYGLVVSGIPCNVARFDTSDDSFIEEFLVSDHGAFAAIGNTRYGWGSFDGGEHGLWNGLNASSHYLGSEFFDAYFNESYTRLGDMLFDSKQDSRWWHDNIGEGTIRWAMYEQILMGSPAVTLKLIESEPPSTPSLTGPTEGMKNEVLTYTLTTVDPDYDNVFYYIDWGDGNASEWIGPYESGELIETYHTWKTPGTYTIIAQAKDQYGSLSNWSSPITITIYQGPVLKIQPLKSGLLRLQSTIINTGDLNATDISWHIQFSDGFIISGSESEGVVSSLAPGETRSFASNPILGLGKTVVTVSVETVDGHNETRQQHGFIFLFFTLINPGGG